MLGRLRRKRVWHVAPHVEDEISLLELPAALDALVELATWVDFRLGLQTQLRRTDTE